MITPVQNYYYILKINPNKLRLKQSKYYYCKVLYLNPSYEASGSFFNFKADPKLNSNAFTSYYKVEKHIENKLLYYYI